MLLIDAAHPALSGWESFYVIVGSSAAALIGLQFVVIALIKDTRTRTTSGSISAFGTPTVVHLGGALVISAIISAPWPSLSAVSFALALCGLAGVGYAASVIIKARRQTAYTPVWEDLLWHMIFPTGAYAGLAIAAAYLRGFTRVALFVIGGAALALLLIAIHNAWDTVTFVVLGGDEHKETRTSQEGGKVNQTEQNRAFIAEMISQKKRLEDYPGKYDEQLLMYEPASLPFGGIYRGMEEFQQFYPKVREYYDFSTFEVLSVHADANVVFVTIKTRIADSRRPLMLCERFEFTGEKITKVQLFMLDFADGVEPPEFR